MSQSSRFPQIKTATRATGPGALPALAVLLGSLLAGCQTQGMTTGSIPDDYRLNHPIILSEREQAVDIPVTRGQSHLTVAQKDVVKVVVSRYRANGSGVINILLPTGSENDAAARRVRGDIVRVMRSSGIPSYNIASTTYAVPSPSAAAPIRLTYSAMTASTNACGKWPKDILNDANNKHWENFGCASQNNLAAQIANPADLLGPRAPGDIDANKNDATIKSYEDPNTNPPTPTGTWAPTLTY